MEREWEVGESAYLKEPIRGYRHVEVTGFEGQQIIVQTSSGMELSFYENEFNDMVE